MLLKLLKYLIFDKGKYNEAKYPLLENDIYPSI